MAKQRYLRHKANRQLFLKFIQKMEKTLAFFKTICYTVVTNLSKNFFVLFYSLIKKGD